MRITANEIADKGTWIVHAQNKGHRGNMVINSALLRNEAVDFILWFKWLDVLLI